MHQLKFGLIKSLCSFKEGQFKGYNIDNVVEIENMSSYRGHQWLVSPGSYLHKTKNVFTWVALIRMVNESEIELQRDWERFNI